MNGVVSYGRISQDDPDKHTATIEERISLRIGYLRHVARGYGIELQDSDVTFDVMTGASLTERTGLLEILKQCDAGLVHTLIIFDIDRFTRDLGDWTTIKRSLYRGKIRLLTARGEYHFTRSFDSMMLDVLAVFGEGERRKFSFRAKAANDQRARKGQLSGGRAAYGYSWDKATKLYSVVDTEYPVVEEIFSKLSASGAYRIACSLNERNIPAPALGNRVNALAKWHHSTVRGIAQNPFYAGYPCKKMERDREGRSVHLPRNEWVWAEEEQSYPHPVSIDEWENLQEVISARYRGKGGHVALLTGLLYCSAGHTMHRAGKLYVCECSAKREPHKGGQVRREVLERTIIDALDLAWSKADLSNISSTAKKAALSPNSMRLAGLLRQQREGQASFQRLIHDAPFLDSLQSYGEAQRKSDMSELDLKLNTIATDIAALRAESSLTPAVVPELIISMINERGGLKCYLTDTEISQTEVRDFIRKLVVSARLEPVEAGKRNTPALILTLYPPLQKTPQIVPLIYMYYQPRHNKAEFRKPN